MPTYNYKRQFICLFDPDNVAFTRDKKRIMGRNAQLVDLTSPEGTPNFSQCDSESLLIIMGDGTGKQIKSYDSLLTGREFAGALVQLGFKGAKLINLVCCNAGSGSFAEDFHKELFNLGVRTEVNARTGQTVVEPNGKQYSRIDGDNKGDYWRERDGTKVNFSWTKDGDNWKSKKTTEFSGYTTSNAQTSDRWAQGSARRNSFDDSKLATNNNSSNNSRPD